MVRPQATLESLQHRSEFLAVLAFGGQFFSAIEANAMITSPLPHCRDKILLPFLLYRSA
jgi:hypothetical protein